MRRESAVCNTRRRVTSERCHTHLQDGASSVTAAGQPNGRRRHAHKRGVAVDANTVGSVVVVRQASAKLRAFPTNHLESTQTDRQLVTMTTLFKSLKMLLCHKCLADTCCRCYKYPGVGLRQMFTSAHV